MTFRVATLNLQQDLNRWENRRELISRQLGELRPDLFALNEISVPLQTGRWIQRTARERLGLDYTLVQQTRASASSEVDAEGILTRFPVVETANLDYRARDAVAAVARVEIEGHQVDIYVTHLYGSRGEDPLRHYQVQQLLEWIGSRNDVSHQVVCGDFNATLDVPSASHMAGAFKPSQTQPTAFTPLRDPGGQPSHPYWDRMDRCIDYVWVSRDLRVVDSGLCFDRPSADDADLWPSDHIGVRSDLDFATD